MIIKRNGAGVLGGEGRVAARTKLHASALVDVAIEALALLLEGAAP